MIKGFTFTIGALAAIALVFVALFFLGAALPETKETKQRMAEEVLSGYELACQKLQVDLQQMSLRKDRQRIRPGLEVLYSNWEKDRIKCAEVMPHERIYRIDDKLVELDKLTRL